MAVDYVKPELEKLNAMLSGDDLEPMLSTGFKNQCDAAMKAYMAERLEFQRLKEALDALNTERDELREDKRALGLKCSAMEEEVSGLQKIIQTQNAEIRTKEDELQRSEHARLEQDEHLFAVKRRGEKNARNGPHYADIAQELRRKVKPIVEAGKGPTTKGAGAEVLPGLSTVLKVLDSNYSQMRDWAEVRPFEADDEAAKLTVESDTRMDRLPARDPKEHAESLEALDVAQGCGLPSLERLKDGLSGQQEREPEFFAAIGGVELQANLTNLLGKYRGPHREEDEYFRLAIDKHVANVIHQLYKKSQQAALDIKQRREIEQSTILMIQELSEELTKEFNEAYSEHVNKRNGKVEQLMRFFVEKLDAVTSREQDQEFLAQCQTSFAIANEAQLEIYASRAAQNRTDTAVLGERCASIAVYKDKKTREHKLACAEANWARLFCGVQLPGIAAELMKILRDARDVIEDAREAMVEEDKASREMGYALGDGTLVADSLRAQQRRIAEHVALADHFDKSQELLRDFKRFVIMGHEGLKRKSEADAAAVAEDLPKDNAKMVELSQAYDEILDDQYRQLCVDMSEGQQRCTEVMLKLRTMERRKRKDPTEFEELKAQYKEANADVKGYSEDVVALERRQANRADIAEQYGVAYRRAIAEVAQPVPSSHEMPGRSWVRGFLFDERKNTRFQPPQRIIMYSSGAASSFDAASTDFSVAHGYEFVDRRADAPATDAPVGLASLTVVGNRSTSEEPEARGGEASEGFSDMYDNNQC